MLGITQDLFFAPQFRIDRRFFQFLQRLFSCHLSRIYHTRKVCFSLIYAELHRKIKVLEPFGIDRFLMFQMIIFPSVFLSKEFFRVLPMIFVKIERLNYLNPFHEPIIEILRERNRREFLQSSPYKYLENGLDMP